MKKSFLFLLLATGFAAGAQQKQSLKDLLYSGKLKLDSNSVVRKDDDLADKIDTGTRKPAAVEATKVIPSQKETTVATTNASINTQPAAESATAANEPAANTTADAATEPTALKAAAPKSNTKIWKEYTDSMQSALKAGVLQNKKMKKDSYFVIVEYEIGETGAVTVQNVTASPENALLQSEVKTYLDNNPLQLQPVLGSDGKGRKTKRKQSFTVVKE